MARRRLTETEREYGKQLRRIKSFITREEKKGFQFYSNAIPTRPKKITKASVRRLAKITKESLYKKAVYGGEATEGEIVSGVKGAKLEREAKKERKRERDRERRRERKQKKQQPEYYPETGYSVPVEVNEDREFFATATIGEYRRMIARYPKVAYSILTQWLDRLINEIGEYLVATMLNEGLRNGVVLTYEIAYDENKLQDYMTEMENYFWLPTDQKAELTDALESEENFDVY